MSYEIVRTITIDKKNETISVTSACNNIRPLYFEKWTPQFKQDKTFKEKLYSIWEYIMWGEFKLTSSVSKRIKTASEMVRAMYDYDAPLDEKEILFEQWLYYAVGGLE